MEPINLVQYRSMYVTPNYPITQVQKTDVAIKGIQFYPNEIFAQAIYNNILLEDYYVSTHGRVYNIKRGYMLKQSPDKDGYMRVNLRIGDAYKTVKVHRLMLMTFDPILNPENFEGNHKDGIKFNNFIWNIEWNTPMENTRHGWDNNLNQNIGEGNAVSVLTDEQVHEICKLLEQGLRACDICNTYGITDKKERMRLSAIISSIRLGKTRRNISSQYNIPGLSGTTRYDENFAYLMCQFLQDGDKYTYKDIMDMLQIPEEDRVYFKVYIDDLLRGRTAKNVTKYYNLKHPKKDNSSN